MSTWIKFCGTTCLEDALASIEAGADALGFVFAPSKRQITPAKAQEIISQLPTSVERIGVFLNSRAEHVRNTLREVKLSGIQLHGNERGQEIYQQLPEDRRVGLRIIKTIVVENGFDRHLDSEMASSSMVSAWLLDSGAGSGKTFNWTGVRKALGTRKARFIIAGGLNPENVGEAMGIFDPWGVDVVSGIESGPGRKDPEKMRTFVAAVRKAEQV